MGHSAAMAAECNPRYQNITVTQYTEMLNAINPARVSWYRTLPQNLKNQYDSLVGRFAATSSGSAGGIVYAPFAQNIEGENVRFTHQDIQGVTAFRRLLNRWANQGIITERQASSVRSATAMMVGHGNCLAANPSRFKAVASRNGEARVDANIREVGTSVREQIFGTEYCNRDFNTLREADVTQFKNAIQPSAETAACLRNTDEGDRALNASRDHLRASLDGVSGENIQLSMQQITESRQYISRISRIEIACTRNNEYFISSNERCCNITRNYLSHITSANIAFSGHAACLRANARPAGASERVPSSQGHGAGAQETGVQINGNANGSH